MSGLAGHSGSGNASFQGWDITHTSGRGRSAPAIAINQRMANTLHESAYGETFVAAVFSMQPVLIAISWHAPNAGQCAEDEELFQRSLGELESVLNRWESKYPGAKTVCGVDANCQLSPWTPLIGPGATGERIVDERRAESIYGFIQMHSLKIVST